MSPPDCPRLPHCRPTSCDPHQPEPIRPKAECFWTPAVVAVSDCRWVTTPALREMLIQMKTARSNSKSNSHRECPPAIVLQKNINTPGSYRFLAESQSPALNNYSRRSEKIVVIAESPFSSPPHPQNPHSQSGNLYLICVNTRKLSLTSDNCFHRSVILIVEIVIGPMKKRSGIASHKALVEMLPRGIPIP